MKTTWEPPKLPSEEFLPPVWRYNDVVGPLFAEFRGRFPLFAHTENSLQHSLGIFLSYAYRTALEQMEKLRPEPLTREEWLAAPPARKEENLRWQRNLKYLRQRNAYFVGLITPHREVGR